MINVIKRALLVLLTLGVLALVVVFDPENVSDVIRDALDIRQSPPPEQVRGTCQPRIGRYGELLMRLRKTTFVLTCLH